MGVQGAALATILSQARFLRLGAARFLLWQKDASAASRKKYCVCTPRLFSPVLRSGSRTFIMQASESVISVCFNSSLLKYGGDVAVGAMTILTSVMQFAMLPLQGLGQGAQPIISYNYGARNVDSGQGSAFQLLLTPA